MMDLGIIGGGPAGTMAALTAAQSGLQVTLILRGVCISTDL
jgi:flavin-dependent dehydrogenase